MYNVRAILFFSDMSEHGWRLLNMIRGVAAKTEYSCKGVSPFTPRMVSLVNSMDPLNIKPEL